MSRGGEILYWVKRALLLLGLTVLASTPGAAAILAMDCVVRGTNVIVRWQVPCDMGLAGFYLERLDPQSGRFNRVIPDLIESTTLLEVESWYEAVDPSAASDQTNSYRLVELRTDGKQASSPLFTVVSHVEAPPRSTVSGALAMVAPLPAPSLPASVIQAITGSRVKILTERAGLHGVSADALAANLDGYTTNDVIQRIAAGEFRLTCGTNELAWMPASGNTGILFYATVIDSIYTKQNVYWIEPGSGVVMNVEAPGPGTAVDGLTFQESLHVEEDRTANPGIFSDSEADIWFWARLIGNSSMNLLVNLPWAQVGEGGVRVELKGSSPEPITPPHHAMISLNGLLLGSLDWSGYGVGSMTFPATNWLAGTNTVRIEGYLQPGDTAGATFYIDSLDVSYQKKFMAFGDVLLCSAESNVVVSVGGFTRADIQVLDVTDPIRPIQLKGDGVVIDSPGAGQWRVTFAPDSPMRRYWVMAGDPVSSVKVVGRPGNRWRTPDHQAEHIVVYHDLLKAGALALVDYRCAHGVASLGIDVEDLYDEFAYGLFTPHAIRSFLSYARSNWSHAPDMVVLAGAGNWDYRNIRNTTNDPCLILPIMVDTPDGLVGADMPLGDTDGDQVPDVVIGRLSVLTSNQMWDAVRKITAVEAAATNMAVVSMVTDANDPSLGAERGDFANNSDYLASFISPPYVRDLNYGLTGTNMTLVRERFVAELNQPRTLVTYMGHANDSALGLNRDVLTTNETSRLTNSVPPVLLAMTCLFGRSSYPYSTGDGFAEQLVRKSTGGLVAVWSCAALSDSADNTKVGSWVIRACFRKNGIRLGAAMKEAMVAYAKDGAYRPWVLETYSLLGDPALDLALRNGEPATYDEWRRLNFTVKEQADPLVSDTDADPDHDGQSNLEEFGTGTLPKDAGSRLWINAVAASESEGCSIHWPSVSNRLYSVEWATNMLDVFKTKADHIWAAPPENLFKDGLEPGGAPVFYRVKLMDVP